MTDMTEETKNEIQSWKDDKDFMEFLDKIGFDKGKFETNPEAVKEARESYKTSKENDKGEKGKEKKPQAGKAEDTLNINGEEKKTDGPANRDQETMDKWKKCAEEHNYIFEDTKEEEYDYSFNLYKTEKDLKDKNPSSTIKCKGNNMLVKSDDLEVYREIARQAVGKYKSVNFLDSLTEDQKKMMLIACLEAGLRIKNPPSGIRTSDPLYQSLPEETKEKVKNYNYKSIMLSLDQIVQKHNPEEALDISKEVSKITEGNEVANEAKKELLSTMLLCSAKRNGIKVKSDFFDLKDENLANVPEKERENLKSAVLENNKEFCQYLYQETEKEILKGEKDQVIDIKKIPNAAAQAITYAICAEKGIKMENVPDMITTDKLEYLPENVQTAVKNHNQEYMDKVKNKAQPQAETPESPAEEKAAPEKEEENAPKPEEKSVGRKPVKKQSTRS